MADDAAHAPSPAAPKPAHVPESLVYDFDLFHDPALLKDLHGRVFDLVTNVPPIFWTPRNGGHWMVTGHEENFELSRDWESFSSQGFPPAVREAMRAQMPPGAPHIPQPVPINLDPPEHAKYRMPLNAAFSPKAMNALKDDIRALARDLIGRIAGEGRSEFMSAVAEPLPVQVFLKLMGLPIERMPEYRVLVKEHLAGISGSMQEAAKRLRKIADAMNDVFMARKANPQNDLISLIWNTEIEGKPATLEDVENFGILLFIAGLDTVMNGIGIGMLHLARDPALQDRLRAHPEEIADASEEMLRRYTFTVPPRRVAKDVVFHGVAMKENDRLFQFLPGADLDPRHWDRPDTYDLDREDKVHIAFNSGPHRCVGSHLARIELQILYEEAMAGLPKFRLDPEKAPVFHGGHVLGLDELHLVWDV